MSGVTITAGWSFSGGITITEAPVENTAAWFSGGYLGFNGSAYVYTSSVDRITYATDTATASVRGPLNSTKNSAGAAGNTTDGWVVGNQGAVSPDNRVERITYATDTATASIRGPLSIGLHSMGAAGNTTDGWFGGGNGSAPLYNNSYVQRITYATDTATASVRGPLSAARYQVAAAGNTTNGWFFGGGGYRSPIDGGPYSYSTVDRITYATDTATASVRGLLSLNRRYLAGAGNTTDGWAGGGYSGPAYADSSTVQRITYATDTATAVVRGPLSSNRANLAASGNTTEAWFGGGVGLVSIVNRITFATDTNTASVRGPLSVARSSLAAAGGIQ